MSARLWLVVGDAVNSERTTALGQTKEQAVDAWNAAVRDQWEHAWRNGPWEQSAQAQGGEGGVEACPEPSDWFCPEALQIGIGEVEVTGRVYPRLDRPAAPVEDPERACEDCGGFDKHLARCPHLAGTGCHGDPRARR